MTDSLSPALDVYLARGMRHVNGWLEPVDARVIRAVGDEQLSRDVEGGVGEIGVHHGKLFILLSLLRRPDEVGLAVDVFEDQHLNADRSGLGDRARFTANLRGHRADGEPIVVVTADSSTLSADDLSRAAGGNVRLFSIDGGHTAEMTFHDLEIAAPTLGPGGVLILDDHFNPAWPGVSEGFARFMAGTRSGLRPFVIGPNKVLLAETPWADAYREAVAQRLAGRYRIRAQTFYDSAVVCVGRDPAQTPSVRRRVKRSLVRMRARLR